jgi:ABC-2 type transport system permease protein
MHPLRIALISGWFYLRTTAVDIYALVLLLTQPFALTVTATYMLRGRPDFDAGQVVVGVALTALWTNSMFFGSATTAQDRWAGLLELLEAAPAPLFAIYSGKVLATLVLSSISIAFCYGVTAVWFQYALTIAEPAPFLVGAVLAVGAFWSLAMLTCPAHILWPAAGQLMSASEWPVYVLCGFLVPVGLLPFSLQLVSHLLPPFWASVALHGSRAGDLGDKDLLLSWLALLVSTVAVAGLAAYLFRLLVRVARRNGHLALV